jgi:radical SAM superfamily enzyme YgiQ (UPF0313 family)
VALQDLSGIPSPYLSGLLDDTPTDGMLMVEVSRWCPYSCSFCLYGRTMGPRLGNWYFSLDRLLAEIAWGKAHGLRTVHFVEANLNLVPVFWPLMHALADLNADKQLTFYAELRAEHLTPEVVAALDAANVRVVEVGLQTANPAALGKVRRHLTVPASRRRPECMCRSVLAAKPPTLTDTYTRSETFPYAPACAAPTSPNGPPARAGSTPPGSRCYST